MKYLSIFYIYFENCNSISPYWELFSKLRILKMVPENYLLPKALF